ncbi:M20/M25/M40 family metallo-hydrolase [Actinomycetospora straminea]|uniref:M20 family metallopeptidase n=1 Tax=Actinomycetospora straminea TaxID=663607 RepID=A0ABP9F2D0_9PSEU|nr:M20/M25/M40 family metallo-hydrolase [Actinomycetospora straminea]MDD7934692.1 M20/M25/M40 family metallo-hydrolase [Actinomycetospora straminea]
MPLADADTDDTDDTADTAGLRDRLEGRAGAMVADLERLVVAESPSSDPTALRACRDVLAEIGTARLGVDPTELDGGPDGEPGGLLWRLGPAAAAPVLLVGHLDTVWPRGTLDRRPFTVADGRATGPGVFDMKAGLVQGLHALAALQEVGAGVPVAFVVTADEEVGSAVGGPAVTAAAAEARAALVLEGSADGGALKHARRGWSFYEIEVAGRAAHAGLEPHAGHNALRDLARIVTRLDELADDTTTVTPTLAAAGTTRNTVPDAARVTVDVRCADLAAQERVDRGLRALVETEAGLGARVAGGVNRPPMEAAQAQDLLATARACCTRLDVAWPGSAAVGGVSDGNLCAAAGTPTLDGLGAVGGGPHAEHEWVDVTRMPERAALVAALVTDLAAVADRPARTLAPDPAEAR